MGEVNLRALLVFSSCMELHIYADIPNYATTHLGMTSNGCLVVEEWNFSFSSQTFGSGSPKIDLFTDHLRYY